MLSRDKLDAQSGNCFDTAKLVALLQDSGVNVTTVQFSQALGNIDGFDKRQIEQVAGVSDELNGASSGFSARVDLLLSVVAAASFWAIARYVDGLAEVVQNYAASRSHEESHFPSEKELPHP